MADFLPQNELRNILVDREAIRPEDFFILRLNIVPKEGLSLEGAAVRVLMILTGRTLNELPYESGSRGGSNGHILSLNAGTGAVEIALPVELCSYEEGLAHLMAIISSPAEYNYAIEYWVENIEFPRTFAERFKGPRFGIDGVKEIFAETSGPILGVMFKPRAGVPFNSMVTHLEEALCGGCDFIADDLLLVDRQGDAAFDVRVPQIVEMVRRVSEDTGTSKGYFANVGTAGFRSLELGRKAIEFGVSGLIVNGFAMGVGTVREIVDEIGGKVPIFTCNMGFGILTRPSLMVQPNKPTGISETVVSKFSRLAGADGVHAGTSASECYGSDAWGPATRALKMPFFGMKRVFPIAEGDLNIANIWDNIKSLGNDVILEPTSGILATPVGAVKAASAFKSLAQILSEEMTDEEAGAAIESFATRAGNSHVGELLDFYGYSKSGEINV